MNLITRIRAFFFKATHKTITAGEHQRIWRGKSKKEIIRELIRVACVLNANKVPVVPAGFTKELRKEGKRHLLKALTLLKVTEATAHVAGLKK